VSALLASVAVPPVDPFGLPAPVWVFEVLLVFTMLLHVLFLSFTLGGTAVAVVLDVLTLLKSGNHNLTVRTIWQMLPVALSFTITTGVAPLLFVQVLFGQFFYSGTVFLGFFWFALVPLLIVAFYLLYVVVYRVSSLVTNRLGRWDRAPGRRLAVALICLVLFLCVAGILTTQHMLAIQPGEWSAGGAWRQNSIMVTPATTHTRLGHNLFGAIAVAGLWLVAAGHWRLSRRLDPPELDHQIIRTGWLVFLPAVGVTAVFGVTFFFMMPGDVREALLRPATYTILWWVGLAAVLGQVLVGAFGVQRVAEKRWFVLALLCALVTLVGMMSAREAVRGAYLARVGFDLHEAWATRVYPQYSTLLLFAACLVLALGAIGWLLWISVRARTVASAEVK